MCIQQRLRSALHIRQSDQSSLSASRNFASLATQNAPKEDSLFFFLFGFYGPSKNISLISSRSFIVQADLNLCWVHISESIFSDVVAQCKYSEPSLQGQHLFPKMLPLK